MKRRAYTIAELVGIMALTPVMAIALSGVFKIFITDLPKQAGLVQESTTLLNMVEHLRRDVSRGVALPASAGTLASDDKTLLVRLDKGVVAYRIGDGQVVRQAVGSSPGGDGQRTWKLPHGRIEWRIWGAGSAVEVHTYVTHKTSRGLQKKLSNSHVLFSGLTEGLQ